MNAEYVALGAVLLYAAVRPFIFKWFPLQFASGRTPAFFEGTTTTLKPVTATLSIFASLAGGFLVLGLVQVGAEGGFSGYILGSAYVVGMLFLYKGAKAVSKQSENCSVHNLFVMDGIVEQHYGPKSRTLFLMLSAFAFLGILAGQLLALGFFLKIYSGSIDYTLVLGIGLLGTVAYTMVFGLQGVIANDIVQAVLVLAVSILVPIAALGGGRAPDLAAVRPLAGDYGVLYPVFGWLFLLPSFLVRADLWQRIRVVKQEHQAGVLVSAGLLLTWFYIAMTTVGIAIHQQPGAFPLGAQPGAYTIDVVRGLIENPWLQAVALAGILLAVLSSVDSYLNLVAQIATKLILPRLFQNTNPSEEEKRVRVANARIATLGVLIGAGTMAILFPDLVDLLSASFALIGVLLPIGLVAVYRKRKTRDLVAAVPLGAALILNTMLFPVLKKIAFIPAVLVAVVLFFVLLKATDKHVSPQEPTSPGPTTT